MFLNLSALTPPTPQNTSLYLLLACMSFSKWERVRRVRRYVTITMRMLPLRCLIKTPACLHQTPANKLIPHRLCCATSLCWYKSHAIYRAVSLPSPGLWPWRKCDKWQAAFQQQPSRFNNDSRSKGEKNNAICTGLFLFTHEIPFLIAPWITDSHSHARVASLTSQIDRGANWKRQA